MSLKRLSRVKSLLSDYGKEFKEASASCEILHRRGLFTRPQLESSGSNAVILEYNRSSEGPLALRMWHTYALVLLNVLCAKRESLEFRRQWPRD